MSNIMHIMYSRVRQTRRASKAWNALYDLKAKYGDTSPFGQLHYFDKTVLPIYGEDEARTALDELAADHVKAFKRHIGWVSPAGLIFMYTSTDALTGEISYRFLKTVHPLSGAISCPAHVILPSHEAAYEYMCRHETDSLIKYGQDLESRLEQVHEAIGAALENRPPCYALNSHVLDTRHPDPRCVHCGIDMFEMPAVDDQ